MLLRLSEAPDGSATAPPAPPGSWTAPPAQGLAFAFRLGPETASAQPCLQGPLRTALHPNAARRAPGFPRFRPASFALLLRSAFDRCAPFLTARSHARRAEGGGGGKVLENSRDLPDLIRRTRHVTVSASRMRSYLGRVRATPSRTTNPSRQLNGYVSVFVIGLTS